LLVGLAAGVALLAFLLPASHASAFFVGWAALYGTVYGLQTVGRANLRQLQDNDPHTLEPHLIEIDARDVYTGCAHVSARYPWHEFTKVDESNEFYLFVRGSGGGVAVPKRLLDEPTEEELRARIREWSPDHGAGLARPRA